MKVLCVRGNGDLEIDSVIARVSEVFPGTAVVDPDYYSTLLQRFVEVAAQLKLPNPNPVIENTTRISKERGIQREFQVPIGDLRLQGRIDKLGCLMVANREFDKAEIAALVEVLRACDLTVTAHEGHTEVTLG